jgi:2-polyprenyl-3-methyl-5-hydroxy-6-metoxy-1,4-benzoquinol methylase
MESITQKIFHFICTKEFHRPENYDEEYFNEGLNKAKTIFSGFEGGVNVNQKTVIDIGCGLGDSCIYMALNGAAKVTGIDIDEHTIGFARLKLANDYANLSDIVEFKLADAAIDKKFDIVFSKDCFQYYADPESFIFNMKQYLKPDGIMVIRFGPLWKAPYGGHNTYLTKVPWVHLIFPESVIMRERKRLRPDEDTASLEHRGRLNKMTLQRYLNIIKNSGLEFEYFKTNVIHGKWKALFNILRKIPFCREYFTQNIYSILRLPAS